jgi:citrate synthase
MAAETEQVIRGLEGVLACESSVTFLDGIASPAVLEYRGYNIHDIAETTSFEEIIHLLLIGTLPNKQELATLDARLRGMRGVPGAVIDLLRTVPSTANPMAVLRTAVSLMACLDADSEDNSAEANLTKSLRLAAQFPTIVAAMARIAEGKPIVEPNSTLGHAANYAAMLAGGPTSDAATRALDTALNLYAEHELNASTFTVRVVVGTLSDIHSSVIGGISALKGPLHGGAIDEAMRLIMEVGSVDNVRPWVDKALAEKRLLMGFGHRVYRSGDARAPHLKAMCESLAKASGDTRWSDIAVQTEAYVNAQKNIIANVDYYAAPVLYYLGFPLSLFTNFVASSRVVGWCAHALEQYGNNRLIRPRGRYTGAREQSFTPLSAR